jgi:hypothetical protein
MHDLGDGFEASMHRPTMHMYEPPVNRPTQPIQPMHLNTESAEAPSFMRARNRDKEIEKERERLRAEAEMLLQEAEHLDAFGHGDESEFETNVAHYFDEAGKWPSTLNIRIF